MRNNQTYYSWPNHQTCLEKVKNVSKVFCLPRLSTILTSKYTNQVKIFPRCKSWYFCKENENYPCYSEKNMQKQIWPSVTLFICIMNHWFFSFLGTHKNISSCISHSIQKLFSFKCAFLAVSRVENVMHVNNPW